MVSVVKYGCMYQYEVGVGIDKNISQAIASVALHIFKLLADLKYKRYKNQQYSYTIYFYFFIFRG